MKALTHSDQKLVAELRAHIRGEVRFDEGSRALYSTDASNYRQISVGVVIPRDVGDMAHVVAICSRRSGGSRPLPHRHLEIGFTKEAHAMKVNLM